MKVLFPDSPVPANSKCSYSNYYQGLVSELDPKKTRKEGLGDRDGSVRAEYNNGIYNY